MPKVDDEQLAKDLAAIPEIVDVFVPKDASHTPNNARQAAAEAILRETFFQTNRAIAATFVSPITLFNLIKVITALMEAKTLAATSVSEEVFDSYFQATLQGILLGQYESVRREEAITSAEQAYTARVSAALDITKIAIKKRMEALNGG